MQKSKAAKKDNFWEIIQAQLLQQGVDLQALCKEGADPSNIKMVCIAPDLTESMQELGETTRDQVVMVRLDEAATKSLDAWVEAGAVKSRSQAAALFIGEGLKVRAPELDQLKDALGDVEKAKQLLREKAEKIFKGKKS